MIKRILTSLFLMGVMLAAQDATPADKACNAEIAMLTKRVADLTKQIDDMNKKATILRMSLAQEQAQVAYYQACAYAGILPTGGCEVDPVNLTVTKTVPEPKKETSK